MKPQLGVSGMAGVQIIVTVIAVLIEKQRSEKMAVVEAFEMNKEDRVKLINRINFWREKNGEEKWKASTCMFLPVMMLHEELKHQHDVFVGKFIKPWRG